MKPRKASVIAMAVAVALPLGAAEPSSPWPEKDLAKFVFEHLDLSSFRNSTGPRRRAGQRFFKDLGIHPSQVSATEATTDGEWRYSVRILGKRDYNRDGVEEVLICFSDVSQGGGSYLTKSSYILQFVDNRAIALAYGDESRAEKSGCRSSKSRADAA